MGGGSQKQTVLPALYHLDTDISETRNVAADHPDVVARLQKFIAEMDSDLGVKQQGPGVRPPGRVNNPVGLYLEQQAPASVPDPAK